MDSYNPDSGQQIHAIQLQRWAKLAVSQKRPFSARVLDLCNLIGLPPWGADSIFIYFYYADCNNFPNTIMQ